MNEWTSNVLLGKDSYVKGTFSDCSWLVCLFVLRIGSIVVYIFFLFWLNMRAIHNTVLKKHPIQEACTEKPRNPGSQKAELQRTGPWRPAQAGRRLSSAKHWPSGVWAKRGAQTLFVASPRRQFFSLDLNLRCLHLEEHIMRRDADVWKGTVHLAETKTEKYVSVRGPWWLALRC